MRGMIMESSKEVWDEFLKRYYWEQILELAHDYPECKSLWVEFSSLEKYNMDVARELLDSPDAVLGHAIESLKAIDLPADVEFTEAHVRVRNLPELTLIKDIRNVHINTLIAVTGLVRKATEVRPRIVNAAFKCARCEDITYLPQEEHYVEPFECDNEVCGRKGPFKLVREESEFIDFQKIRIQDSPDEVRPGEQPQTLDAIVTEDLTGRVSPGDRVVLVGDPGVAKSQCLRYSRKLAPRGVFTSGRVSTSAGLTATAVKDNEFSNGRWTLEAGALVLADMGLACVDELDKMEADDRSSIHEAMEQQTVTINKAGINTMLRARCAVLGAANPKFGRFDRYEPIGKQINLPPTLLSRFDLIFVILDEPTALRDTAVSNHIFNTHIAGELSLRRKNVKDSGITEKQVTEAMSNIQPVLDAELLRKYIAYAKRTSYPVVQPDARQRLTDFYLSLRKLGEDPNAPLPVTARQLEALIRLAEASARTRLSGEATIGGAQRVIRIVTASLNQIIKDPDTGKLDSDIINAGMGKSQRDRIKLIREAIRTLQGSNGNDVPMDLILQTLEKEGLKKEYVEDAVARLKTAGELIETSSRRYRTV